MSYVTASGERRTTISVRLKSDQLAQLDELRDLIAAERTSRARAACGRPLAYEYTRRDVKRSDALRWALDHCRGLL